jgi:lipid-A-disaccharide synthase
MERPAVGSSSVFIIAGEASGDWSGALLARELRRLQPDISLAGIGSRRMAGMRVDVRFDCASWGAIGVLDGLSKVPQVWGAMRAVKALLRDSPPSLLVLIDFGAFNMRVARLARRLDVPVLYYFPPGSWSHRPRNLELRDLVEAIATPFPWSAKLLAGGRARVEWVGHPVREAARPHLGAADAWRLYRLDPERPVVGIAPGSRNQEIRYLLPVLAEAAARIARAAPGVQFLMPLAPAVDRDQVSAELARAGVTARLLSGMDYDALQLCQAAAVCSGTATLEFCCLGVPMVITYRTDPATTAQYRVVRGLIGGQRLAGMPNIIAGREVCPERMAGRATPEAIAGPICEWLAEPATRERVRRELTEVAATLGEPGASARTAALALEVIAARRQGR